MRPFSTGTSLYFTGFITAFITGTRFITLCRASSQMLPAIPSSFSSVEATFSEDELLDVSIKSSGDQDLMPQDLKDAMAAAIKEAGSTDVDAVSSATLSFSRQDVIDAFADILAQATA